MLYSETPPPLHPVSTPVLPVSAILSFLSKKQTRLPIVTRPSHFTPQSGSTGTGSPTCSTGWVNI